MRLVLVLLALPALLFAEDKPKPKLGGGN